MDSDVFSLTLAGTFGPVFVFYVIGALFLKRMKPSAGTVILGFFAAWILTTAAALIIAVTVYQPTIESALAISTVVAFFISGLVIIVMGRHIKIENNRERPVDSSISSSLRTLNVQRQNNTPVASDELDIYAIAEEEVDKGTYNKGTWAKALVDAEGDETKRKFYYIKMRVAQHKAGGAEPQKVMSQYRLPVDLENRLIEKGLLERFAERRGYQQKGYIRWINRATSNEERAKRIEKVVAESQAKHLYMGRFSRDR